MADVSVILNVLRLGVQYKKNSDLDNAFKQIIKIQEEQVKVLESISSDIHELKKGPLYSANIYLSDAAKSYRTFEEKQVLVNKAREKFIDALGIIEAGKSKTYIHYFEAGCIEYLISLCWFVQFKINDTLDWLDKSLANVKKAREILLDSSLSRIREVVGTDGQYKNSKMEEIANFIYSFGVDITPYLKMKGIKVIGKLKIEAIKESRRELKLSDEMTPFLNLVEQTKTLASEYILYHSEL